MTRWPLVQGKRVFIRGQRELAVVTRLGKVDVEVYFPKAFNQGPRVFLWDQDIVPVDLIVNQVLGRT